jgi:hypothetical protein
MTAAARPKIFPAVLASLMQEIDVNQVELSRSTTIAVSRVNNYLQGKYRTVKPAHLGAIVEALGGAKTGGLLVEAYLFDLLPVCFRGLVEIKYPGMLKGGKWTPPSKGLGPEFASQFADLYKLCVTSVNVRQRTQGWIEVMREVCG